MLTNGNDDQCMNVFDAVNWAEINENDRILTLSNDCPQFFERQRVFGGSGETKLSRGINRQKRVSPIQSAIAPRKSASAISTPKLPKTIRRQAGTHE